MSVTGPKPSGARTARPFVRAAPVLLAGAFLTFFDRAMLPPLLTRIAAEWDGDVGAVGLALSAHVTAYGFAMLLWAAISSRIRQLPTLRISLTVAAVGGVLSAVAWDPASLATARAITGAAFAATVPASIVYFSETLPLARRGAAMANLASALALGMAAGTAMASVVGHVTTWRWAFGATAAMTFVILVLVWLLPPERTPPARLSMGRGLRALLTDRWNLLVLALAVVEGAVLVGALSFLPVALEFVGEDPLFAGLTTSVYGVAIVASAQLMKRVIARLPSWAPFALGGGVAVAAYALLVMTVSVTTVIVACIALGFAWATAHTHLQTWLSDVSAVARPFGAALFGLALFGGGAVGTVIGTGQVVNGDVAPLFLLASALSAAFTVAATVGRLTYRVRGD